ncbi:MAG: hypothetical protein V1725_07365, partial [archaeon]
SFLIWEEKTHKELTARKRYMIHYVRQHWATIKMYTNWIRPYLRSIGRLTMREKYLSSPEIITAFETAVTEVEFFATKPPTNGYHPVIIASFKFNTKPMLQFQQDSYQARGAIHVGKVELTLRAYSWKPEHIEQFRKLREEEDMEIMSLVDSSVAAAMEALGDDLEKYLKEAGEDIERQQEAAKEEPRLANAAEPFIALFGGFGEMFKAFFPLFKSDKKAKDTSNDGAAKKDATISIWLAYKNYKKSHGMLSW